MKSAALETTQYHAFMVKAVWAMFVGMIFDFLDGKVARLTGSESAFGVQIDSLSDVMSFGLVPAVLFKALAEFEFGISRKASLILAAFYLFGAVLRLARFNVETEVGDHDDRGFKGLPSPAAAAGVASIVVLYCSRDYRQFDGWIRIAFPYLVILLGILMWTKLPYIHAANVLLTEKRHPVHLLVILATIGLVYFEPTIAIPVLMLAYALSGPALYVWDLFTGRSTVEGESLL